MKNLFVKNLELKLSKFLKKQNIQLNEIKQEPGLYISFCKSKQKIYIGQSMNIYSSPKWAIIGII